MCLPADCFSHPQLYLLMQFPLHLLRGAVYRVGLVFHLHVDGWVFSPVFADWASPFSCLSLCWSCFCLYALALFSLLFLPFPVLFLLECLMSSRGIFLVLCACLVGASCDESFSSFFLPSSHPAPSVSPRGLVPGVVGRLSSVLFFGCFCFWLSCWFLLRCPL